MKCCLNPKILNGASRSAVNDPLDVSLSRGIDKPSEGLSKYWHCTTPMIKSIGIVYI